MRAAVLLMLVGVAVADDAGIAKAQEIAKAGPAAAREAIPELIAIGKGSAWERFAARDALAIAGPPAIARLIEGASGDGSLRLLLEGVSFDLGAGVVAPALPLLGSEDPKIRAMAAVSLGAAGKGGEAAVKKLIEALYDKDAAVRREAAIALGRIGRGAHDAVPALINTTNDAEAMYAGLRALGMILRDAADRDLSFASPRPETRAAIDRGLAWLARHQEPDGRWDGSLFDHDGTCGGAGAEGHDVELTALALLAFLNSGDHERHAGTVRSAWRYLVARSTAFRRHDGPRLSFLENALTTAVLYDATRVLGEPECEHESAYARGMLSWSGYEGFESRIDRAHSTGWAFAAIIEGTFVGQTEGDQVRTVGRMELKDGPGESERSCATEAAAALARIAAGEVRDDAVAACLAIVPAWEAAAESPGADPAGWPLLARAILYTDGTAARLKLRALEDVILPRQHGGDAGCRAGSWDVAGPLSRTGGRVYMTATMVLSLEAAAGLLRPLKVPVPDATQFKAAVAALRIAALSKAGSIRGTAQQALAGFAVR